MYVKAKKILASELMYAKNMSEDEALEWLEHTLTEGAKPKPAKAAPATAKTGATAKKPAAPAKSAAATKTSAAKTTAAATTRKTGAAKKTTAAKKTATARR
jgi:DNA-binding protein HU-beta